MNVWRFYYRMFVELWVYKKPVHLMVVNLSQKRTIRCRSEGNSAG